MGGSDSKPQEQKQEQEQVIINKKNNKRNPNSPSNSELRGSIQKSRNQDIINSPRTNKQNDKVNRQKQRQRFNNNYNQNDVQKIENYPQNNPNNQAFVQNEQQPTFFSHWLPQFHNQGSVQIKVMVLTLQPTPKYKNIQRQHSQHIGTLSWSYQQRKTPQGAQLLLRLIFQEEGGYYLSFLADQSSVIIQGDQPIWDLICPFRTKEEVSKIGGFNCERTYESSQPPSNNDESQGIDPQLFIRWQQKVPEQRKNMRNLLQKRRENQILKSNKGFQYRQVSKYFAGSGEWAFSVLLEEKFNTFRCWMMESGSQKYNSMSTTLKSDIENRESMFVQEMKKKRNVLREEQRNKVRI